MKPMLKLLPLVAAIAAASAAYGQIPLPGMREYYEGSAIEKKVADATALIIPASSVHNNGDGTYRIESRDDFLYERTTGWPLCTTQTYFGLKRSIVGRTAILVGSDLMMTTPHTVFSPNNLAVVFGLNRSSALAPYPDFRAVPAPNISFTGQSALVHDARPNGGDYMVFRLDSAYPLPTAAPLPLRRSGTASMYDRLTMAGYPEGLPLKFSDGGYYLGPNVNLEVDVGAPAVWGGSSGSPAFNLEANVVETQIAHTDITRSRPPHPSDPQGMPWMYDETLGCATAPVRVAATSGATNYAVSVVTPFVAPPPNELQVSSQTQTVHVASVGGAVTNPVTTFQVAAPSTATSSLPFTVAAPSMPGGPSLSLSPAAGSYSVSPGGSPVAFTITASGIGATSCTAVDADFTITPTTGNGFPSIVRHRFEIGMTDFVASPRGTWTSQQLAPYDTSVVEVRNTRAEPVAVTASSAVPWLRVNGGASVPLTLAAAGAAGDRANLTIDFNTAASGFPASGQLGWSTITIAPTQPSCSLRDNEYYTVRLTPGSQTFVAWNNGFGLAPPDPGQTFGTPTVFEWNLSGKDAFTIADANLTLDIPNILGVIPPGSAVPTLKIELEAPNGQRTTLWDRQTAPAGYLTDIGGGVYQLKLDDQTTPPLGPGLLATFNGLAGNGVWRMYAYSTHPGGLAGVVDVQGAELTLRKTP